jgi:superfamily I DNA/RNA helicase
MATMHLAKGLEFRAVAVMTCEGEVVPLQSRIEAIADDADVEHVHDTERHLLYAACTRSRGELLVTSGGGVGVPGGSGSLNGFSRTT